MLIPNKLAFDKVLPPTNQPTGGPNPNDPIARIQKERKDTVALLRDTEQKIRTTKDELSKVGTQSDWGKIQKENLDKLIQDQATYYKKINFLDSRLKNPNLAKTYIETKQPVPAQYQPSFGQEVLLGQKEWQKALMTGQEKYQKMADNALETLGFQFVPPGIVKDIAKGALNPLTYTEDIATLFGDPNKFMEDKFYTMADTSKSPSERAMGALNFAFFVASVVPGAKAIQKGGVKQLVEEAVEKAVKTGANVEKAIAKFKNVANPEVYQAALNKAKEIAQTVSTNVKQTGVKAVTQVAKAAQNLTPQPVAAGVGKMPIPITVKKQPSKMMGGAGGGQFKLPVTLDDALNSSKDAVRQWLNNFTDPDELQKIFDENKLILRKTEDDIKSIDAQINSIRINKDKLKNFDYAAFERKKKTEAFDKWAAWKEAHPDVPKDSDEYIKANKKIFAEPKILAREEFDRLKTNANLSLDDLLSRKQILENQLEKTNNIDKDIVYRLGGDVIYHPTLEKPTRLLPPTQKRNLQRGAINIPGVTRPSSKDLLQAFFGFRDDETKAFKELLGQNADNLILPVVKLPGIKIIDNIDWVKTKVTNGVANPSSFSTKEQMFNALLDDVYNMVKPAKKSAALNPLDPVEFQKILDNARKQNLDITDAQLRQIVSDFKNKIDANEIIPKGGTYIHFPQNLQTKIADEIKNTKNGAMSGWARKLFGSGLAPEKRFVERNLPSALPTINLRSENLKDFYTALGDKVKTLEPVFNKFKNNSNSAELQPITDILRKPFNRKTNENPVGIVLNLLDGNIKSNKLSPEATILAQSMYDTITDLVGKGIMKKTETLSDFIMRTSGNTSDKVFSMAAYKKLAEKKGRQAMIDELDPLAVVYHLTNVAQQQAKVQEAVFTRNVLSDFIQKTIDELGDTEAGQKQAGKQLIDLFTNVNSQLKQSLPGLDVESKKILPPLIDKFLDKSSKLAGKSMIAGNVSTALSQLSPIAWNLANQGIMPTLAGIAKQLYKADIPLAESTFLTNRFKQNVGDTLYTVVRDRYLTNPNLAGGSFARMFSNAKKVWGEGVVDTITKNTIEAVDKLVSNITFTTAYQKAINAGSTKEEAIRIADNITEKIISGRAPGDLPPVFSNDLFKSVLQYQLEVMNQGNLIRDLFKSPDGKTKLTRGVISSATYLAGAYLLNNQIEKANNRRPIFDPVGLVEDYYKGQKLETKSLVSLPPSLQRVPSKSYFKDAANVANEVVKNITGISNIDLSGLPSLRTIKDVPAFFKTLSDPERANKNAAAIEIGGRLLTTFIKGGSQARKTILGIRALNEGYVDESQLNPKLLSTINQELDDLEEKEDILNAKNRFERNEKNIKISPALVNKFLAIVFGPKATSEYRGMTVTQEKQAQKIKTLKNELNATADKAERKLILQEIAQAQQDYREKFGGLP